MLNYLIRRILLLVFVLFAASIVIFVLMQVVPGDPATLIAMHRFGLEDLSRDELAEVRKEIGLDTGPVSRYFWWLQQLLQGHLGVSYITGEPVLSALLYVAPATLELATLAALWTIPLAFVLGVTAAQRPNGLLDHLVVSGTTAAVSIPEFWLGLLLILLFSVRLDWFPVAGRGTWAHLVLPVITITASLIAANARVIRSAVADALRENYITVARSKGLPEARIVWRHALRNALIPSVTVLGLQLNHLIGATVVVETVFARPGLGRLIVDAIYARDLPLLQGGIILLTFSFALVNLLVDLSYPWIDPRVQYAKRGTGAG